MSTLPRTPSGRIDSERIASEWMDSYCGWGSYRFGLAPLRTRRPHRHGQQGAIVSDEAWFEKNARRIA